MPQLCKFVFPSSEVRITFIPFNDIPSSPRPGGLVDGLYATYRSVGVHLHVYV
jgi:hypothetical protein